MENKTELVNVRDNSPAEMIRLALEGKGDLSQLRELLTLQREHEANEARKLFALSFANAQAKIEAVLKTKNNPQTHSKYADLGDVIESAKPVYTAEGFSIIFYESDTPLAEHVRICADVLHKSGHKETYHYDTPLDGTGLKGNANMTKIHGKASSVAYARRYLMCMIWNIPTADDDGNTAGKPQEVISKDQINFILDALIELNMPITGFLNVIGIESIEVMPVTLFKKAELLIETKRKMVANVNH
jgi:hypothetical protein